MRKTKELDSYLKRIILKVPDELQRFLDDEEGEISMIYYSGKAMLQSLCQRLS